MDTEDLSCRPVITYYSGLYQQLTGRDFYSVFCHTRTAFLFPVGGKNPLSRGTLNCVNGQVTVCSNGIEGFTVGADPDNRLISLLKSPLYLINSCPPYSIEKGYIKTLIRSYKRSGREKYALDITPLGIETLYQLNEIERIKNKIIGDFKW